MLRRLLDSRASFKVRARTQSAKWILRVKVHASAKREVDLLLLWFSASQANVLARPGSVLEGSHALVVFRF